MRNGRLILSAARTLSVVVMFGLLVFVGWFVMDTLKIKDSKIESLQNSLVENYKEISIMTNAYITVREDNINLLRNIEFWKRQCEMLIRENHELKGIPVDNKDISKNMPKQPAPPPKGTNDVAVVKADNKVKENEGQKQVPGRLYDKNGKEYIIKDGKKVYIVRKKVPAKPKEPPKEPPKK